MSICLPADMWYLSWPVFSAYNHPKCFFFLHAFGTTSQNLGISETSTPNNIPWLWKFVFNFVHFFFSRFVFGKQSHCSLVRTDNNLLTNAHSFAPNEDKFIKRLLSLYLLVFVVLHCCWQVHRHQGFFSHQSALLQTWTTTVNIGLLWYIQRQHFGAS